MERFEARAFLRDVVLRGGKCDTHEHVELHLPFVAELDVGAANALLAHGTPFLGEMMDLVLRNSPGASRPLLFPIGWGKLSRLALTATEDAQAKVAIELVLVVELTEAEHLLSDLLPQRMVAPLNIEGEPRQAALPGLAVVGEG
jgi:hypothetical protein